MISYEVKKPDTQNLARKNLNRFGLASRVDFKLRDIAEGGFDETDADSFFLDVQIHTTILRKSRGSAADSVLSHARRSTKWKKCCKRCGKMISPS
ncbi:MAG: hypothetical protein U0V48_01595 [Anaerolineales bacterium]